MFYSATHFVLPFEVIQPNCIEECLMMSSPCDGILRHWYLSTFLKKYVCLAQSPVGTASLGADYMANFSALSVHPLGLKFCCDNMRFFSPGTMLEIVRENLRKAFYIYNSSGAHAQVHVSAKFDRAETLFT